MNTALVLGVYVLAAMRLTKLINSDTILDPLRLPLGRAATRAQAAAREASLHGNGEQAEFHNRRRRRLQMLVEFIECPWCVGFWIALVGAVVPVLLLGWPWWTVPALGLAASQIIGMAAPLFADDDIEFETVEVEQS